MPLTTIFVIRHGFRSNWSTNSQTGEITSSIPSPTGIPSDPALSAYGETQALELAELAHTLDPPVARIYSSPFYRCVQTIAPLARKLGDEVPVHVDRGIGEWYGTARFTHPSPAPLPALQAFFPFLTAADPPLNAATTHTLTDSAFNLDPSAGHSIIPAAHGESSQTLHARAAYAAQRIIAHADAALAAQGDGRRRSIVLVSHAATVIALGRALVGRMPEELAERDFCTHTAGVSRFERRGQAQVDLPAWRDGLPVPDVGWRDGRGVGGGWACVENSRTGHLSGGAERDWHFSGEESFLPVYSALADAEVGDAAGEHGRAGEGRTGPKL